MMRVSDATFPVLCLQSVGRCTQADIEHAHRVYLRAFHQPGRVVCISDARLASHSVEERRLLAAWSERITPMGKLKVVATVIVLDSFVLRGALTALNWLFTPEIPQRVAPDLASGIALAQEVAAGDGLTVPPECWRSAQLWLEVGYARHRTG